MMRSNGGISSGFTGRPTMIILPLGFSRPMYGAMDMLADTVLMMPSMAAAAAYQKRNTNIAQ